MWGSNVQPSKFGRGSKSQVDWVCICDHFNKKWYSKCEMCGTTKELCERVIRSKNESKK